MGLYEKIISIYPELANESWVFWITVIILQDDSDGRGPYIAHWEYEKPQPTQEELDAIT